MAAFTPAGTWWFERVSGLSSELSRLAARPVLLLCVVPALVTYRSWYRALYVSSSRTAVLTQGVLVYTVVLFAVVFAGSSWLSVAGATLAAGAMAIAQAAENGYLLLRRPALYSMTEAAHG